MRPPPSRTIESNASYPPPLKVERYFLACVRSRPFTCDISTVSIDRANGCAMRDASQWSVRTIHVNIHHGEIRGTRLGGYVITRQLTLAKRVSTCIWRRVPLVI